jgi:dynein heavy chain, axonemal
MIEGSFLRFSTHCATFITMNPNFVGRTPLPDNLRAMFRDVTMVVPDISLIIEIILYGYGFGEAKGLAMRVTKLFSLVNEQLKFCPFYDFGLRVIKPIIVRAGTFKLKANMVKTKEDLDFEIYQEKVKDFLDALEPVAEPSE